MKKDILSSISKFRTEIMGFAALWILFYHEWRSVFGSGILGEAERFVAKMGYYGVDMFLFLSGMGLTYAVGKYTVAQFYRRRYTRILVPYVIALAVIGVVRGWDLPFFIQALTGWRFWLVDMYTALWYTHAIMALYLVFPLYYWLVKKSGRPVVFTAVAILLWYAASNLLSGILRFDLYGFTNRIPIFLTGVLAGEMANRKKSITFTWKTWVICLALLLVGVVTSYLTRYHGTFILVPNSNCALPSYLVALSGVCLLAQGLSLLHDRLPALGKGLTGLLAFYGAMSLELYCIQDIVLGGIQVLLLPFCPDLVINLINFAAITLAAWLLHRVSLILYKILKF